MKEEKRSIDQTKKAYIKPTLSKIHLVAEEAVLALCKWNNGAKSSCQGDRTCVSMRRS